MNKSMLLHNEINKVVIPRRSPGSFIKPSTVVVFDFGCWKITSGFLKIYITEFEMFL